MINPDSRTKRGTSLIEAIIVTTLFLIAMTLVTVLFRFSNQSTEASKKRTDLLDSNIRLTDRVRKLLASSHRSGNTYFYFTGGGANEDLVMSLITTKDVNGVRGWDEDEQWSIYQGYDLVHLDLASGEVRHLYYPIAPTEVSVPLTEAEVRGLLDGPGTKPLLSGVTEFCLYDPVSRVTATVPSNPVAIRWSVTTDTGAPYLTEFVCKIPSD